MNERYAFPSIKPLNRVQGVGISKNSYLINNKFYFKFKLIDELDGFIRYENRKIYFLYNRNYEQLLFDFNAPKDSKIITNKCVYYFNFKGKGFNKIYNDYVYGFIIETCEMENSEVGIIVGERNGIIKYTFFWGLEQTRLVLFPKTRIEFVDRSVTF